jgi:tetratricopeptide (TPR) repeat protein
MRTFRQLCLLLIANTFLIRALVAMSCPVAPTHGVSDAERAYLQADYDRAALLFSQALQQAANDPALTAGLADVLLKQQKVAEADQLVTQALSAHPKSVVLETALGLVQYREGRPNDAAKTASSALTADPCYPRAHLLAMYLFRLNSMYKAAEIELRTAHALDPSDPAIHRYWLNTLPLKERIAEAEAYLASPNGDDPDEIRRMRLYVEELKKTASEPHKACQIVSSGVTTVIPFAPIMETATRIRSFGLDVKLNDQSGRLEIDTGASGLLISRSLAKRAGLEAFSETDVRGIGTGSEKAAYTAFVNSIKIGSLEFRDCAVTVLNSRNVAGAGVDGLIGMDVFSNLQVTLDYPMRKLALAPLPPRPQEGVTADKPALETKSGQQSTRAPHDRYIAPEMSDWTKVYRSGHNLLLPAMLNESAARLFILDTGAFTTTISPEAAREVTKVHSDHDLIVRGISGKVEKVYSADNITFRFAHLQQRGEGVVAFDTSNLSKSAGLEVSGLIGFSTLSHLTVKIDYRDALVKFEYDPKRGFRTPQPF